MSFTFMDRKAVYPNRYKVTPLSGDSYYVYMERADEPTEAGTPLNAETFNALFEELSEKAVPGADGVSPTIVVSKITGGNRLTITDKDGVKVVDVMDGTGGSGSGGGTNGKDGRGIVSVSRTSGMGFPGTTDTYTITYTDNTTSTFTVRNGSNGANGKSAYQYAQEGGFTGTEADFIKKLNQSYGTGARIGQVTLTANGWNGSGNLYSQVVTIDGVTVNSQVDLTPSVEQLAVFYEKDLGFVTENNDGVVTVYAIGQKPQNDYVIQVTITEVIV